MTSESVADGAERYFHERIPVTRAMGVRVVACDEREFIVEASVAPNANHLGTAFGGSINAIATLAGYGYLWNALRKSGAAIVIAESSIRFVRPVYETIRATCLRPGPGEWTAFRARLDAVGKASIVLKVSVVENGEPAATFEGIFVARLQ